MTIDMSQFYQVFFDEADELLAEMEKLLLALDVSAPDSEDLNAIFRAAHSIKGGAATFAFTDITEVTHMLESLLDSIRKGEMGLTPEHVDAFLVAKDVLTMLMDGHHHGSSVDQPAVDDVCQRLKALSQGMAADAPVAEPGPPPVAAAPEPAATPAMDADGNCRFRIELPEVPRKDVDALAAELGLLGTIEQETLNDKRAVFILTTDESQDNIVAICSFVLDPDDLKITCEAAPAAASSDATSSPPIEDPGYGIFEPEPAPAMASQAPAPATSAAAPVAPAAEARNYGRRATDITDAAAVEAEIDTAGIWTGDDARDAHLRAADFLDVEKYPTMSFRSGEVRHTGEADYEVSGTLDLHGVKRPVVLTARYLGRWQCPYWEGDRDLGRAIRIAFTATTTINRHDFGVSWNAPMDHGGLVVGDEVAITLDVEAILESDMQRIAASA